MTDPGLACRELVELVTAYLDGALDAQAERGVREHLALCDGCSGYVEQIRRTVAALGELPPDALPDSARDALLAAFRQQNP